ncbi:NACHT domain-containing protein [Cobetia crustatorum]|nr:NACHT domain-containing protein [Cobetia crustatorum]
MSGIEKQVVASALKASGGFLSILLSGRINELRSWAHDRELRSKLSNDKFKCVIKGYLMNLSGQVNEITSIAFPQRKLLMSDAYEPLNLYFYCGSSDQEKLIACEDIVNSNARNFVIIDDAGMGKSTFSKFLVSRILLTSHKVPVLFELRKINFDLSLEDNLAANLDEPGKPFDRNLFYKMLREGLLYIVLDGFDEVELEKQNDLAQQIFTLSSVIKSGNIVLTIRPQDSIPHILNAISLRFKSFTTDQVASLLDRYDTVADTDIGKRLMPEIERIPEKFIESPLLVSLIYRTYGVNNTVSEKITTFYDEVFNALYKGHDLVNKNGYIRQKKSQLDFESFRKLLRALSFYMMVQKKSSFVNENEAISFVDKAIELCDVSPNTSRNYLDDLLVSVPLMQRDGSEIKFIHKTVLEYFAAEYIVLNKSSEAMVQRLFSSNLFPALRKVFDFVYELNADLYDSAITLKLAELTLQQEKSNSDVSSAISTMLLFRNAKIGFWKESEYAAVNEEFSAFPSLNEACLIKTPYKSISYTYAVYKGERYFLAIAHGFNGLNHHSIAEEAITTTLKWRGEEIDTLDCFREIYDIIGESVWVDMNSNMFDSIVHGRSYIMRLVKNATRIGRFNAGNSIRVLCPEKAKEVIEKVNRRKRHDDDIMSLLSL